MTIIARGSCSSLESAAVDADILLEVASMTQLRANEAAPGPAFDETSDPTRNR